MQHPFPISRLALLAVLSLAGIPSMTVAQDSNGRNGADQASLQTTPYWSDTWRGWHFYEEPEADPEDKPIAAPKMPAPDVQAAPAKAPELVEFEHLQKTLEDYRNIAIMRPSETNVRRYMELESQVVAQASYFADVAQRVAWATPELDPTVQGRPVNAKALEVFDREQLAGRSQTINALGQDHVLLFFFRGDCPYCHAFAPTLAAFALRHGIQVVAISVDGGSLPGFADARADNGIAATLKVSQVPAVYLAQPFTGKISPIGFGVLSEAELVERIATVATPAAEALLPSASRRISLQ